MSAWRLLRTGEHGITELDTTAEFGGRSRGAAILQRLVAVVAAVASAAAGDRDARDVLLAEIQPLVQDYCRGRLGRSEGVIGSAEDVARDVCVAVIRALPHYEFKGLSSFRAFVYGIAAHKVTDAFQAIGRSRADSVAELPDSPVPHDGPEQRLVASAVAERLGHLLHRLTPRQRAVLVLRIAVGLSAEETAQVLDSTPGAVRVTQHRALNRLRGVVSGPLDVDPEDPGELPRRFPSQAGPTGPSPHRLGRAPDIPRPRTSPTG
jgi:RNA polymerase sigma-70 factor (ECF subfamily)